MIRSSLRRRLFASTAVAALAWAPAPLLAQTQTLPDPTDGNVLGGALGGATIGRGIDAGTGKDTLTVTVDGNRPVIEWTRFGVGADQAARFVDARGPLVTALERSTAVLNRVTGDDNGVTARSDILGELTSSPTLAVYLTNPQGILFGPTANVAVGSLVATTLAIDPDAFRTAVGTLRLNGSVARPDANGDSSIAVEVQSGARLSTLGAGAGGRIALIGAKVISAGTLDARNIDPAAPDGAPAPVPGTVALVAATDVRVSFDPESPLTMTVTEGSPLSNLMTVSGTLKGGSVLFAAATERTVRDVVLGIDADVEATTAVDNGSGVLLVADRIRRADLPVTMDLAPAGTPPGPAPIVATLGGSFTATGASGAVGLFAGSIVAPSGAGAIVDAATTATIGGADAVEVASVTADDLASLNAGGAIRVDSVQAGDSVALSAGGALTGLAVNAADERLAATLTSTGADVTATAGGLALFGDVSAATDLRLQGTSVTAGTLSITNPDPDITGAADRIRAEATLTDLRLGNVTMAGGAVGGAELIAAEAVRLADVTAGSVRVVAGHGLDAGTLTARTGDVNVQATGRFAPGGVAGGLTATGLSAESGRVIATTTAGGTLDVTSLTAGTEATLTSDGSLTLREDATVSNGALTLTGTGVTLGDGATRVLSAPGRVAVTATASALTGGTGVTLRSSAAGEAVLLRARDGIDFAGRAEAVAADPVTGRTGDVILQPGGAATLRLTGRASGRSLLLRNADGTVTGQLRTGDGVTLGSVDVDRDLVIASSAAIRLADVTVRRGTLELSGTTVNASGTLSAAGVTAVGDSVALADVDATAGAATLEAGFNLTAGAVSGIGVDATGGRDVSLASVDARSGAAILGAGRALEVTTGAVKGNGVEAVAGDAGLRLNAVDAGAGTLTLSSTGADVRTGRLDGADTTVTAATGLTTGIIASTGQVDLLSRDGSVTAGGQVTGATGIRMRAASDVELTGGGSTAAGDLTLTAGQAAGRSAVVRASGALAATTGQATLTGADGIAVGAVSAGGNTTLNAAQGAVTSGALGGATVSAIGRTGVTTGAVTAGADASLTSVAGQVTAGNVQAATGVLLDGRTGVVAGDVAGGTGSATLRSAGGGVTAGRLSGLGVEVTALNDIGIGTALGGAAGGAGGVRLVADQGGVTVIGRTSGQGVTTQARTSATMGDVDAGSGDARLSSGAALDVGDVSGALVRLNGVGRVDAGLLSGNQVDVISAAGIRLGGAETSGGDIVLDAEDGVTVSGLLRSGRDVLATGGGALSLGEVRGRDVTLRSRDEGIAAGDIIAQRLIDAESNTGASFGALTAETILLRTRSEGISAGDVTAVRDLQLAAIGNLSLGNVGVANGAAQLSSRDGHVTTGAITTTRDIRVEAQTGVAIGDARAGVPWDPADLLLTANAGPLFAGDLTARTMTLTQRGTGTLSLGRAVAVDALTVRAAGNLLANRLEGAAIDASSDGRVGGRTRDGLSAAGGTLLLAADGTALLDAVTLTGVGDIRAGALDLRGDVATGGALTLAARGEATLGATDGAARTVASDERLTLTAGTGPVTGRSGVVLRSDALGRGGARDLTLAGGNGIAFAADTLVAGGTDRQSAVRLGAGAGTAITLDAVAARSLRATDGSATLTHEGAIRATRLSVSDPLLLRAEGAAGTIALDRAEVTDGDATLFATGDVALGRLETRGATEVTSVQGSIGGGALMSRGSLVLRADAASGIRGAIVLGSATVAGDATLTARTIAAETLVATGSLTADTRRTLATPADQSIAFADARADGDATIRSAGALLTDRLAAGGTLDLAATGAIGGRNSSRATLTADRGAIRAVAGSDMRLDRAAAATDLSLGAAGIDATTLVAGGNVALTASAAMTLGSVSAEGSATLDGGSVEVGRAEAVTGDLSLTARLGAVRAALARARQALTVTASSDAVLGQAEAGAALRIEAGGTLRADDLAGASAVATASDAALRRVAAGSGGIDIATTRALQLETATSDGAARLVAGTDAAIEAVVARGDVLGEAGGTLGVGRISGETIGLAGGTVGAGTVEARQALTVDARTGNLDLFAGSGTDILLSAARDATLGQVAATGLLRATAGERLNAAELRGTTLSLAAANAELATLAAGSGGLDVLAGEGLRIGQATSAGEARLEAGADATLGTLAAAGDVAARAGDALTIGALSGEGVELAAGSLQAESLSARGLLAAATRTGDLRVTSADAADLRFVAAGNATLGQTTAAGLLQVEAGDQLNGAELRGTTVELTARNAELRQVDAGTGGLSVVAREALRLEQATSGGTARLEAGTDAVLGTVTAAGDVAAQVGNLLTVGTLSGEGVVLDAGAMQAEGLTARGSLTATTRTGDLGVTAADGSEILFAAAGNATLGRATAAGLLQAEAGAQLNAAELRGTSVALAARNAELRQVDAGTGGLSVTAREALRVEQATSGGSARLEAGTDAALGTLAAAGDVAAQVGNVLTVGTLSGEGVVLDAGAMQAESLTARGSLTATTRTGDLGVTAADGSEIRFAAAGNATLGRATAAGLLQVEAGGQLNAVELRGLSVELTARNAELRQVDAGTGGLVVTAREALRMDRATSGGLARLEAGTDAVLGTLSAAGDVVARAGNLLTIGTLSGEGVDLVAGVVRADSITARGALNVTSPAGDLEIAAAEGGDLRFAATRNVTLGRIAATGLLQANAGERLNAADLSGTTISLTARNGDVALVTAGSGGLEAVTVEALRLDRATSAGPVRVTAGTDATLGTLAAAGDVAVGAGGLLSVGTLSGLAVELTGGAVTAGTVTVRDALTATARTGGLDLTGATGTDVRLTAATDSILGTVTASGRLDADAGGRLTGADLRAGTLAIVARDVSVERAAAGAGGLSAAATQRLALTQGESGGTARLVAGTAATLGTLTAAGDVVVEAGGMLDARALTGAAVSLTGATVSGGTITARGILSAAARTGDLSITTATGTEARFSAAGDLSLGTASAAGVLQAEAGGQLAATDLDGGTVTLRGRDMAVTQVVAGAGGIEARGRDGLRIDRATSGGAAVLAAGTDAVLGVVSAAGDLSAEAGGRLTLADGTGSGVTLTGGSVRADKVAAAGSLTAVSRGDLTLAAADAASMRLTAAGNAVLGSLRATNALQAGAGERLGATELRGGTVSLSARDIVVERATAGSGGLEAVAGQALSMGQVGSSAGARLSAGTDLILGTLSAMGAVSAEAARAIRGQSVSGADVGLAGDTIVADRVVAQGALTATARGGELRIGDTQAGSAALESAGDMTLGTVAAARGVTARAAGLLGLTNLTAAEADLAGGTISVEQATVAGSLKARAGAGGLRLVRAELGRADLGSQGGATLTSLAAREDVTIDAAGPVDAGTVSGTNLTLTGGSVTAGSLRAAELLTATARGGDLRVDRAEAARARLTASGDATLGTVAATGDVAASAGGTLAVEALTAANAGLAGGRVTVAGAVVRGALEAAAGTGGLSIGTLEGGSARLTSGADAALGQGVLTGALVADAAGALSVGTASAASATLAGGSAGLGGVTIAGPLTVTARGGDLRLDRATAGTVDLTAIGNAALGTVVGGGRTTIRAGGVIGAQRIEGGDVTLDAGSATLGSVAARGALSMTTTGRLAWTDATAGGAATVAAGEIAATSLAAGGAGDLRAQGGLTIGTLRATGLSVRGGSVSVGEATATAGDLLVASSGSLGLATGTATGTADLTAAGDATLGSVDSRGAMRVSAGGLTAQRLVSGSTLDATLARGSIGTAEAGGALSAAATGDLRVGSAAAGGRLALGAGGALAVDTLRAGGDAALTATGAASVAGAATVGGAYRLRGASVTLGTAGATQRQSAREIAVEATAASLLGTTTLAASGTAAVTATGGAGTIAFAPESSVEAATVQLSAANRADLGAVTSTGALTVSAADLGLARTVRGASVRLTNNGARGGTRLGGAPTANAAEFQAAGTGFDLDGAELGLVQTPDLAIAGGVRDMVVGTLSVGDGTGAQRLSLLTTGRVDVLGRMSVSGVGAAGARQVTLGGNGATDATAARSSVVRVAATQDGGGRLLMGTTALTINGDRIGIGLDRDFLDAIGYRGAGLSVEQVTRDYVARPTSTLYNAGALGAAPYADGTLLQAHSLSLGYGRYALIQNTAPAGEQRGAVLGVLGQTPAVPTLSLRVNDANNTFALFGTIDGISSSAAALLGGDRISVGAGVSPIGSRVNGCVIGSGGGCLTASIAQPTINLFNTSRAEVVRSADDLSLPFDPLVGTNNESLYLDPAQEAAQSSQVDCNKDDAQCRPAS